MTLTRAGSHTEAHDPHWVEWVVGIVSTLLVVALIGWVAWQAVTVTDEPPDLATRVTAIRTVSGGYRVEFEIENRANTTAAAVVVRGTSGGADEAMTAEVTFDYVPAGSRARGALLFARDPAAGGLTLRPVGYAEP